MASLPRPRLVHGIPERLAELVDNRRRNVELTLGVRLHFVARTRIGRALVHYLFLKHPDTVDETFRTRWTSGHEDVDRYDRVDSLHDGVVVEHPARRCTCAHRDAPLRLRHLLPDAANDRSKLEGHAPRADEDICLSWGKAHALHAEAREIEITGRGRHELDRATGGSERHRPQRVGAAPVHEKIQACRYPAFL